MAKISNVSYIRARDPSIRSYYYRDQLKKSKRNIEFFTDSSAPSDDSVVVPESEPVQEQHQQEDDYIQVYLRIKASKDESQEYFIQDQSLTCRVPEQPSTSKSIKEKDGTLKKYTFTEIFGPESKQAEIFDSIVKPRVLAFINGENSSLFTYGASGAGKTFTIVGNAEEPGLIPRALEYLFRTLPELPDIASVKPLPNGQVSRLNRSQIAAEMQVRRNILKSYKGPDRVQNSNTYCAMQARLSNEAPALLEELDEVSIGIWVSFIEIYNEEIVDLLQSSPSGDKQKTRLRIGITGSNVYVKDLTHVNVSNGLEAFLVFHYGIQKLQYAKTILNNHSSRSHSIFSIKIAQSLNSGNGVHISTFNFGDLAGVERSKKTKNVGDRLKESNSINTSLMVLGRCFAALRHSQKSVGVNPKIPFRESKLTQLLQRALFGFEDLCMIVNINTSKSMMEETHAVLNFSAMTKEIVIQPQYEQKMSRCNQLSKQQYLRSIDEEIDKLKSDLSVVNENYLEIRKNMKNFESEKQRLIDGWKEILSDNESNHRDRMKALESKYERLFKIECDKVKRHCEEKSERSKRRKLSKQIHTEEDLTFLQDKSFEQQAILSELQKKIHDLKEEKEELPESFHKTEEALLDRIKTNNEILCKLGEKLEIQELNSFLMNEKKCVFSQLEDKELSRSNLMEEKKEKLETPHKNNVDDY